MSGSALGAKVADEIAHGAVAQAVLLGEVGQRPALDEEGAQHLIAALQRWFGIEEELLAEQVVIHEPISECVTEFLASLGRKRNENCRRIARPKPNGAAGKGEKTRIKCADGGDQ